MINDFEYLYMIRQNDSDALEGILNNFHRLIWKRSYEFYSQYKPIGISVDDLFQEGSVGFHESLYTFKEVCEVGFAFYVNLCVVSSMRTALRKCRAQSYKLLDSRWSLDMSVSEDSALYLGDCIASENLREDPKVYSHYEEAKMVERKILAGLLPYEVDIYRLQESGYSYQEIAERYGLQTKNIDNIIQKIRRRFSFYRNNSEG